MGIGKCLGETEEKGGEFEPIVDRGAAAVGGTLSATVETDLVPQQRGAAAFSSKDFEINVSVLDEIGPSIEFVTSRQC
jgi:hypothetical protein